MNIITTYNTSHMKGQVHYYLWLLHKSFPGIGFSFMERINANPKNCKFPKIFGHWSWQSSLLADVQSRGKFHIICEFFINPSSVLRSNPKPLWKEFMQKSNKSIILIIFFVICYKYHHYLQMYNQRVSSEYRLTQR